MGHDQLFKAVLQAFFRDFLHLFYPNVGPAPRLQDALFHGQGGVA